MSRWERKKTIIYKVDAPTVRAPPWAAQSEPPPDVQFSEATRTAPSRPALVESDVTVPFMQSLISGLAALIIASGACLAWGWDWSVPPIAAGGVFCAAWFALLVDHRKLLRTVEVVIGRDLDGDGYKGEPPEAPTLTLDIQYRDSEGRVRQRSLDLPGWVNLNAFRLFALAALKDWPISEKEWTPEKKGFSVGKFRRLMTLLEKSEILKKEGKAKNSPRKLTEDYGRPVLEKFLEELPYLASRGTDAGGGRNARTHPHAR